MFTELASTSVDAVAGSRVPWPDPPSPRSTRVRAGISIEPKTKLRVERSSSVAVSIEKLAFSVESKSGPKGL